jgi:hypothetical protein
MIGNGDPEIPAFRLITRRVYKVYPRCKLYGF